MHDCNSSDKKEGDGPFSNPRAFAWHRDSGVQVPTLRWAPRRTIWSFNYLSSPVQYLFNEQGTSKQCLFTCTPPYSYDFFSHQDPCVTLILANLWQRENPLRSDFYIISFLTFTLRYFKSSRTSIYAPPVYICSFSCSVSLNYSIVECFYPLFVFLIRTESFQARIILSYSS